jgi:hypothetical protein
MDSRIYIDREELIQDFAKGAGIVAQAAEQLRQTMAAAGAAAGRFLVTLRVYCKVHGITEGRLPGWHLRQLPPADDPGPGGTP